MRYFLCAFLLIACSFAQDRNDAASASVPHVGTGTFYVAGIVYQYVAGQDYTVVAAAHSIMNHKVLAVKVRVYNTGRKSVTIKPEDIALQDGISGRSLTAISGTALAKRMQHPYNWERFAVNPAMGNPGDSSDSDSAVNAQMLTMMRAMTAKAGGSGAQSIGDNNVLYTDTSGALRATDGMGGAAVCDQVCQLRNAEARGPDPLKRLQRDAQADDVQQSALLANTIPPRENATGLLYCPLKKLAERHTAESSQKKSRVVRVSATVAGEVFELQLPVE